MSRKEILPVIQLSALPNPSQSRPFYLFLPASPTQMILTAFQLFGERRCSFFSGHLFERLEIINYVVRPEFTMVCASLE